MNPLESILSPSDAIGMARLAVLFGIPAPEGLEIAEDLAKIELRCRALLDANANERKNNLGKGT